jgi:large subunit ribosomal protein L13
MKTYVPSLEETHQKRWWIVDAADQPLGRIATRIAAVLRGKHKPTYTPHLDMGDHVVVVNASQVKLTGNKANLKEYFRHSGYMGGERFIPFKVMLAKQPERVIELAVKGMMPKNALGKNMFKKLKVYAGAEHPHQSQKPEPLEV